jgi:tRNA A37 threonylcarbamoyladenosine dehydratase
MPGFSGNPRFQRLALLAGIEAVEALQRARVIVFGVGGVGSWAAEALVRSAVGHITIVDSDWVCVTNINRQVQATETSIGLSKVEVLKKRLLDINRDCEVTALGKVFSGESAGEFNIEKYDYVIDGIDSITNKIGLIEAACQRGVTLFSSMGTAQKLDPTRLKTASIWETKGCPLARLVRAGLRKRGFDKDFTVVYSTERLPLAEGVGAACGQKVCLCPKGSRSGPDWCGSKKVINGSAVPVTAAAGMILASLVLQDIYGETHG